MIKWSYFIFVFATVFLALFSLIYLLGDSKGDTVLSYPQPVSGGSVEWSSHDNSIVLRILKGDINSRVDSLRIDLVFERGVKSYFLDWDDVGSEVYLSAEDNLGDLVAAVATPVSDNKDGTSKMLNVRNIYIEKNETSSDSAKKIFDGSDSRRSGGDGSSGGGGGGGGGGTTPTPEPPICSNDPGCASVGDFCDGNIPYNCTSDINGCFRRSNKSECEIWQVCDGGNCACLNDPGCASVGDFCDGNIPYNCTSDINGCFRRSNKSECGDACFNGDCILGINCGTLIDESGSYFLTSNISLQEDLTCIGILSDDVNFNCLGNSIDGNGTNNTAIYIMGSNNVTVENCSVYGMEGGGEAVVVDSSNNTIIKNSNFFDNDYGIFYAYSNFSDVFNNTFLNRNISIWATYNSSGLHIRNNNFLNRSSLIGIYLNHLGINSNVIENNLIRGYSSEAISVYSGSGSDIVRNNTIENCYAGVLTDDTGIVIDRNIIFGATFGISGVRNPFVEEPDYANITISNNEIHNSSFVGISLAKPINTSVFNNTLYGGLYGIRGEFGRGVEIYNNSITNFSYAVTIYTVQPGSFLINNTIKNNSRGFYADTNFSNNITVVNNKICGNLLDVSCNSVFVGFGENQCSPAGYELCGTPCQVCE
jgi:parallel beta-helix repeat protein